MIVKGISIFVKLTFPIVRPMIEPMLRDIFASKSQPHSNLSLILVIFALEYVDWVRKLLGATMLVDLVSSYLEYLLKPGNFQLKHKKIKMHH